MNKLMLDMLVTREFRLSARRKHKRTQSSSIKRSRRPNTSVNQTKGKTHEKEKLAANSNSSG